MAEYKFHVHYVGGDFYNSKVMLTILTKSLLSLSYTLQKIQHVINPYEPKLSLDIVAKEKGYFIIYLILDEDNSIASRAMNFLTGQNSKSLRSLISYVDIFGDIIDFNKKVFNHKIINKKKLDNENISFTLDDNTVVTASEQLLELYKDVDARNNVREVLEPLGNGSIDTIYFYHNKKHKITVNSDDYKAFDILPRINVLETSKKTIYLEVISANFQNGRQWKFYDGANQFTANIKDKDFLESVKKNQQQIAALDTLKAQLETQQYINVEGQLKKEESVVKVLKYSFFKALKH